MTVERAEDLDTFFCQKYNMDKYFEKGALTEDEMREGTRTALFKEESNS